MEQITSGHHLILGFRVVLGAVIAFLIVEWMDE